MPRPEHLGSAEQPLQGVMLCFTSIGPEDRSRYADIAIQMGADHKLDLTSDTTHLIVGSTDSLKYQYVAREREDIRVLRPEWIEAVRDHWINDLPLDLDALTQQYCVPTLAGLKICITGFDDLSFRAQLQKNVKENGGEYTGDLTKDVTHLIAARPEGKKYEYGMQWQKKVVSLKWYKDTLERGMQLDESLYHPTVPVAEQGVGAWSRKPRPCSQLGKRTREENVGQEPVRKLRRTASARLGSQNQDMWSDIVGGAGFEAKVDERPPLKPSISMPALRRLDRATIEAQDARPEKANYEADLGTTYLNMGLLSNCRFIVQCFEEKKKEHLRKVLAGLGATIACEKEAQEAHEPGKMFVILPHDVAKNGSVLEGVIPDDFQVVSELWLEKCMLTKSFIASATYPLGQVITGPLTCLEDMTINATGFDGIETVHISKIVALLGGRYTDVFTSAVSVLICKAENGKTDKIELAQHLGIPSVTEEWLWSTIKSQSKANIGSYLHKQLRAQLSDAERPAHKKTASKDYAKVSTVSLQRKLHVNDANQQNRTAGNPIETGSATDNPQKMSYPPVTIHQESLDDTRGQRGEQSCNSEHASCSGRSETQGGSYVHEDRPLRELSPTSARRNGQPIQHNKAPIRSFDGASSIENSKLKENISAAAENGAKPADIEAINGAIRDILNEHSKKKAANSRAAGEPRQKNRLVGRALSNLSNSSSTSNLRRSRASSIDSMNTDGIGSEIPPIQSAEHQSGESASIAEKSTFIFTGRAKTTLTGLKTAPFGMDDPDLARAGAFQAEQEAPPRMTQLGYEDPEEAILLREKLAASRKKRSRKDEGEKESENEGKDPKPLVTKQKSTDRKIRDDDILAGSDAGWGAGRRTRPRQRGAPQGIKEF